MRRAVIVVAVMLGAACVSRSGTEAPTPAPTGAYAVEQAERGRETFRTVCATCHAVAEFRGSDFAWRWRRQTAWDLYRRISTTMPITDPGGLPDETYADVIAYVLSLNGHRAGALALAPTERALAAIPLTSDRGS